MSDPQYTLSSPASNHIMSPVLVLMPSGETFYEFNGTHYRKSAEGYYVRSSSRLHREVWKYHHGPIPAGRVIHHADGNPGNNELSNLRLMTNSEHLRHHNGSAGYDPQAGPPTWALMAMECSNCGAPFMGSRQKNRRRLCSTACREQLNALQGLTKSVAVYTECVMCGRGFHITVKNSRRVTCGPECLTKLLSIKIRIGSRSRAVPSMIVGECCVCGAAYYTSRKEPRKTCGPDCCKFLQGAITAERYAAQRP